MSPLNERPRKVLVVDDDDDLRASVALILVDEGWEVQEARHGGEALDLLEDFRPSVMLLDWRMPIMDGGQVLDRLRGHRQPPGIVLITASAHAQELATRHQLRHHVAKPFAVEDLLSAIEHAHAES